MGIDVSMSLEGMVILEMNLNIWADKHIRLK